MTTRTFAPWVEPIARRDREGRAELLEFARSVPPDAWDRASPVEGWTYRDVLAHLASDTGKWFAHILRTVLSGKRLDPTRVGPGVDLDPINARGVAERRGRSIAELIAEIEADGEEHQELLSRLTGDHRDTRQAENPISFGEFLSDNPAGSRGGHDREHLAQLRTALEKDKA
jgi:uncharacterized protein (TIGR03083 family)